jgi:hypothetical protein
MASFNSAGYISFKPAANPSGRMARAFTGPQIHQAAIREDRHCPIGSMSSALSESAGATHRVELEDVSRRIDASRQLKDTIVSLKDRLARRMMMRAPLAFAEDIELSYKAS